MTNEKTAPSLRQLFLRLVFLRLLLPLLILGLITTSLVIYWGERNLENQQNEIARSVAQIAVNHLNQGCQILNAIANIAGTTGTEDLSSVMSGTLKAYEYFDTLYYLDANNKIKSLVPSLPRYLGLDMSNISYFQGKGDNKDRNPIISRPFISPRTGEPTVYLIKTLTSGGKLVGELNLGLLQTEITNIIKSSDGDFVFILDQYGTLIAHPFPELVKQQTNFKNLKIVQQGFAGKPNALYQYDKTPVLAGVTRVENTGWLVVDQIPLSSFFVSYACTLLLALLGSLIIWLVLIWNLRKQLYRYVSTPLEQLSKVTNDLIEGDYNRVNSFSSAPTAFAELNKLTSDFQLMSSILQSRENKLVNMAQELREADNRKNEFLGVLSHELRNPLASITSSLSLLELVKQGGTQEKKAKDVIKRQIAQLSRMVDDLLDITRISRNKIKLQKRSLELNEIVQRSLEDYQLFLEQSGLSLEAMYSPTPIYIDADETRLMQIIGNLLHNAAKFSKPGGYIKVFIESDSLKKLATIHIADNGIGIAPEMLSSLFQPFMQAESSLDRSRGGLGLGLALVKGLVDMHGGSVSVSSAGLDKGSEFTIRIPINDKIDKSEKEICPNKFMGSLRVLVIDDNADIAEILKELLTTIGYIVEIAKNGTDGIKKAINFEPEILICDIGLPGMNGYDVARAFRSDQRLKDIFLIAMTGYALPEDLQKAFDAGFDRHLAKPVDLEKLEYTLSQAKVNTPSRVEISKL